MSKTSKFRKIMDRSAYLWLSVAAFFVCMLSYVPLAAAQGAHVTAMGQQTMDRFLCDLPYVVSLPVALLLAAILAVCAVRGKMAAPACLLCGCFPPGVHALDGEQLAAACGKAGRDCCAVPRGGVLPLPGACGGQSRRA